MRAEISQPPTLGPGFGVVTVREAPPLDPDSLLFSVENPPRGFLQETLDPPWGTTHAWLKPVAAIAGPDGLELTLGPDRTWSLRPNVTYVLRLRDAATTTPAMARIAWKGIRMPSRPPEPLPARPALAAAPAVATDAPVPIPEVTPPVRDAAPVVEAAIVPRPTPRPKRGHLALTALLLLLLLLGGGAAGWWFYLRDKPRDVVAQTVPAKPEPATPEPVKPEPARSAGPLGPASARAFLQTTPSVDVAYAEADRYLKEGSPDALQGALVLLSRAAEDGSGPAQTALGRMYDPDTFATGKSAMKAPDSEKALLWYQRAAKANDPEGTYRLGKLLLSGRVSAPGLGPEQGAASLQRAAGLGSAEARAEIDKLRKPSN